LITPHGEKIPNATFSHLILLLYRNHGLPPPSTSSAAVALAKEAVFFFHHFKISSRGNKINQHKTHIMRSSEFDSYIIYHEEKQGGTEKLVITCFYEEKTVGFISFHDGDVPKPEVLPHGVMKLNFHMSRIREILDTIRYEKPLFISVSEDKSMISSVREPVGEQEGH
jgi:hypothetical protein